jgi:hypothetical protein
MKEVSTRRLKEKFFPPLLDNLNSLEKRLSEEDVNGEGYVTLLNKGWKSFWILDFRKFYRFEEEALFKFKRDLERYEEDLQRFKNSGDEKLKEKTLKRKLHMRKTLPNLIRRIENIM